MTKYLDSVGLQYLWDKIASIFAKKEDVSQYIVCTLAEYNGLESYGNNTFYVVESADDARDVIKIMKGSELMWPLPYDAEVEYLQSSGTQYIATNVIPTSSTGMSLDFQRSVTNDTFYMGMRNGTGDVRFVIAGASNRHYVGYGKVYSLTNSNNFNRNEVALNLYNSRKATFNGDGNSTSLNTLPFTPNRPIYIFKANDAVNSTTPCACKVFGAKITEGNTLVHDFIPVRKNGVGYLYDKVSGELFGNDGSGIFGIGPDK